jgi:type III secretion protein U
MAGESEDKPLPPSAKKLLDARRKGQVYKSKDFVSAIVTLTTVGFIAARVPFVFAIFTNLIRSTGTLLEQPPSTTLSVLSSQIAAAALTIVGPLLALLIISAILANILVTRGPVLSLDPLIPRLQKLNPAQGLQNLVSINSVLDVFKGLMKLVVIVAIAVHVIRGSLPALVELPSCGLECATSVLRASLISLVGGSVIVFLIFGLADLGLQRWLFIRKQRMSLTEMKNERKNTDGNPLVRSAHKRERREASRLRAGMSLATFIVSGTRIAVAMRYSATDTKVPISVARAEADEVLSFIRDARQLKLPIVHDPATARVLFDKVHIGKTIPTELFQAVIDCMKRTSTPDA